MLAGDLARITSGAWLLFHFGIDLLDEWKHEAVGPVLTATCLGFIIAADAILGKIFTTHPAPPSEKTEAKSPHALLG